MRGQESVHTDSDAYNSQIMEQIVQSDCEDMTPGSVKNPMLILAHKKIRRYRLYKSSLNRVWADISVPMEPEYCIGWFWNDWNVSAGWCNENLFSRVKLMSDFPVLIYFQQNTALFTLIHFSFQGLFLSPRIKIVTKCVIAIIPLSPIHNALTAYA